MTKNFSYFLAKRYLVPKGLFLIFINVLTILGICLGVAVMIVVLSVMKGFENEFQRTLLG
ncbi:MAG: ABC transporter permease, partial [Verrucomicrobiaceae bacterium]|nr:ABC transporter permease [Verrucomicrobiaceae bacterium]